ncbi:MAG: hypothetical protein Q8R83_07800, partial [Legionellaceae bacterium]|nr:hypothetical protein [Legionellaceae bacterium]
PFLAEKIWIINESVSYFNKSDAPTKVARLLRRYAPRNDEFKNRTVQSLFLESHSLARHPSLRSGSR